MSDLTSNVELLWRLYEDERSFAKHHESQRTHAAGILITLSMGLIAVVSLDGKLTAVDSIIGLMISVLGVFGVLFNQKHYERSRLHLERGYGYYYAINDRLKSLDIESIRIAANTKNANRFPFLTKRRLGNLWVFMHVVSALVGIYILLRPLIGT